MDGETGWTIAELASRVASALATGYSGPHNGRVREVPNVRAIRWYASIGLLDKPEAFRGRTALYGERHLRQLVAVKRRQAAGASLEQIQTELTGASDARLRSLAGPIDDTDADDPDPPRFWTTPPATVAESAGHGGGQRDVRLSYAVRVADGVTVLFDSARAPDDADLTAVAEAADGVVARLRDRGLAPDPVPPTSDEHATDSEGGRTSRPTPSVRN